VIALPRPIICLVSDRQRLGTDDDLTRLVSCAADAGVNLVHIRERHLDDRRLHALTTRIVSSVSGTRARVVVNDRVDVALAAGAHGVHLRADSFNAERVRRITPPSFLLGRAVHSVTEATAAGPVDYIVMGTVFPSRSKGGRMVPAGLEALQAVCRATDVPVLAIGGVTVDRLPGIAAAGAAGVAAIGLYSDVMESTSDEELNRRLRGIVARIRGVFAES
jgi:thiamine-phosphate pyrophosphorylase